MDREALLTWGETSDAVEHVARIHRPLKRLKTKSGIVRYRPKNKRNSFLKNIEARCYE